MTAQHASDMKHARTIAGTAMSVLLSISTCAADALHKHGIEGTWLHADSGWLFPVQVSRFSRTDLPYSIDGNNDVGVEYEHLEGGVRIRAIVEVFSIQSAAAHAVLESAQAVMQDRFGALASERGFSIESEELEGHRFEYGPTGDSNARLYFFRTPEWIVNIRSSTVLPQRDGNDPLDDFVRTLPWPSLGSDAGLH